MTRTGSGKWVRAAVVQAGAVPFDSDACVDKAVWLIQEAAATGAKVIVFPEAFIGGWLLLDSKVVDSDSTGFSGEILRN